MNVVECHELTKRYGTKNAINNLTVEIAKNKITGLIGRNGAGKTTLLKMIAGYTHPSSGELRVFEENPFNNLKTSANTIFIDYEMNLPINLTLQELLHTAKSFYPNWNEELAQKLLEYFSFNPNVTHGNLSKGMKSTFNIILGLAARCPLTIFDEPTSGMDSSVRSDFYRVLLKDYLANPRTIILSSHLINEVEDLLEDILLIKDGEKCLHLPVEEVKEYAVGIRGKSYLVEEWLGAKEVLFQQNVGTDGSYVVIKNELTEVERESAAAKGLTLFRVVASDLCMYLTSTHKGGIDHVFN